MSVAALAAPTHRLNGVAPYFTMFPLRFPLDTLRENAVADDRVLDPFCGRGTVNFACRLLGLESVGLDSSPVAVALARAKLAVAAPAAILAAYDTILGAADGRAEPPQGEFWAWAFHPAVLHTLCALRAGLRHDAASGERAALLAILLGALHGPRPKGKSAYCSNQSPRTYAPKPRYAARYWRERGLRPERVDVRALVAERAERYYGPPLPPGRGHVARADSRREAVVRELVRGEMVQWVITSPPYYGLRTYLPDQWQRHWFLGGPPAAVYAAPADQLGHQSPDAYVAQLRAVWRNARAVAAPDARLVVRFGGIHDRPINPGDLLERSLRGSGWTLTARRPAGSASHGRRQALHFAGAPRPPIQEYDYWATADDPP